MTNNLFLVDTSAWIFALKRNYVPVIKDRIADLLRKNLVLTTGIIRLELLIGTKTQEEFERLKARLDALQEIPSDKSLWDSASNLGFTLRRQGVTIPATDIFIASAALASGATIVHADAHFDMISKKTGLNVESFVNRVKS